MVAVVCPPNNPPWTGAVEPVFGVLPNIPPVPKVLVVAGLAGYFGWLLNKPPEDAFEVAPKVFVEVLFPNNPPALVEVVVLLLPKIFPGACV